MGLLDDLSTFLEQRLEEFLRSHPELELQALDENLREQEADVRRSLVDLQAQQQQAEKDILSIAQEIQRWHERIQKAQAANRPDLVQAAQEREATLLRQGNQRWGQMEVLRTRLQQTQELLQQVHTRRQEVQQQVQQQQRQTQAAASPGAASNPVGRTDSSNSGTASNGWYHSGSYGSPDPLEAKFRQLETDLELEELKRSMGR